MSRGVAATRPSIRCEVCAFSMPHLAGAKVTRYWCRSLIFLGSVYVTCTGIQQQLSVCGKRALIQNLFRTAPPLPTVAAGIFFEGFGT